jgi:hypothetical protein
LGELDHELLRFGMREIQSAGHSELLPGLPLREPGNAEGGRHPRRWNRPLSEDLKAS